MNKKIIIAGLLILAVVGGVVFYNYSGGEDVSKIDADSENITGEYTLEEVQKHATVDDCWMVISSKVYDVTSYIPSHPSERIADGCGKEATSMFENERKHKGKAVRMLDDYLIGSLNQ